MHLEPLENIKKKSKNFNTIQRHLTEISSSSTTNISKLLNNHRIDDHILYHYHHIHQKAKTNESSFHGYLPLTNKDLIYNSKSLYGTVFVLSGENMFQALVNNNQPLLVQDSVSFDCLLEKFKTPMLPFLFMSKCELFDFKDFMRELYQLKSLEIGDDSVMVFKGIIGECSFYLVEPHVLTRLDLDYLVYDVVVDEGVFCLLYGFICVEG